MPPEFTLEHASGLLTSWIAKHPEDLAANNAALDRYSKYFAPENLDLVTEDGFKEFLLFKNNRDWDKLHRHPEIYADMDALRRCLKLLLNEELSIESRLDQTIPKGATPSHQGIEQSCPDTHFDVRRPG